MKSSEYCLIYNTFDLLKKYEPIYRKFRVISIPLILYKFKKAFQ